MTDRSPAAQEEKADHAEILEAGFGQDGDYTWVTSLVSNTGHVGEFATVVFNLFDETDTLIATEEQVEIFTSAEGVTAIGTQTDTTGKTVARVEATLEVSDYGSSAEPAEPVAPVDGQQTAEGDWTFTLVNGTAEDWSDLRVGIICRSAEGTIVGGGGDFPSLVPAGGQYLIDGWVMAASPASCTAYPQLPSPES
ncbi:hypothetical protein J1G44_17610 [Cellulomonas sp. zg-ZUI199]|uniref:Uncharacterized protein n=1 Tax=Cellulomonas wangleii TaxID=2816956 RepID=A0ABX8D5S4_9CELL|nr:hypothetical protein [Cellulomonas wangleii]MBO0926295.1 hypothetical protein [Cellulomonas wangleii]QVI62799.1 hypothetical protein KG103_02325 [Cellulomonas wangleii]